ncbi:hypothetical protein [Acanthopleuribacter pedis]|uniref:Uncharacterized protein n=1 Tax=Acanthopleuribacter pedis TaxID=442870 RepID=A0A8J7Q815_9BACT|nr:hypothetical protein [Acanthopleuribacter pedis]MBO1319362.1 hypothetical protein [Acanthopleuribacter pedis]
MNPFVTTRFGFRATQVVALLFLLFGAFDLTAQSSTDFEARKAAFRQTALANLNNNALPIQAFEGLPLSETHLDDLLSGLLDRETSDFVLVVLMRVLCLTDAYDERILPIITQLPFWLRENEDLRVYWSENHMIMWMSSDWLMMERFDWSVDDALRKRLIHYLNLKIEYGYYEFFSSTYYPYTLSGLLNLADFSQDMEIAALAASAAQRLMADVLLLVNEQGAFFPAAGRNYVSKYLSALNHNHDKVNYLFTGLGPVPTDASHASAFVATSSVDFGAVIDSWRPQLNQSLTLGHPLSQGDVLHAGQSDIDRIIFQWSAGGYFHPDLAEDTLWLLDELDLWEHHDFNDFAGFEGFPAWVASTGSIILASITRSSVLTGVNIAIYKDGPVSLTATQGYWSGRLGYQLFPWVASTGTIAVWTQSGEVKTEWRDRGSMNANTHLPHVTQNDNVALVMYQPNVDLPIFGIDDLDVALYWPEDRFDETRAFGNWVLGREGDGYVAVYKHCNAVINGHFACDDERGQTWAVVVGNNQSHGDFDAFETVIRAGSVREQWRWDWRKFTFNYVARVQVDGKTIEKTW